MSDERRCWLCGAARDVDDLLWTVERDAEGRVRVICPPCTRRHARDIEVGLPSGYW